MAFEFLSNLNTTTAFLLLIIFILFVVSMKKAFSIILNAVWIVIAAILFPVVMNRFFGFDIPIDRDSMISFILLGLTVYFVYLVGKSIYKVLGMAEKAAKKVPLPRGEKKVKDEKEEKPVKTDKKREKELEEREKELQKKEQQIRFASAIQKKRRPSSWQKDYLELEAPKEKPKSSHITPLPVIEHKKKKKREED
ncbi:MAG TPA: hypothetical protein HA230_01300 [Candidatus Aenigmarchaeota archaeon]|nr:hypothetical protein [Candidatus Aenigmarchaeota archaeon]